MAADERFKKKSEQVRILLDDLKKLSRYDNSIVPTLQMIDGIKDAYNREERQALSRTFHKEGGVELYMKILTSLSPDGSNIPDSLQRPMEWSTRNVLAYVQMYSDPRAISLLTDMVNRPSHKNFTALENIVYPAVELVKILTLISITAGIRRKMLKPGAELEEEALQEILPELREKLKVEAEKRDYTLEWGDIAVHPTRRSVQKWPKARDGRIYVPYKVSLAFCEWPPPVS
ncbi:uncharacterized protein LOC133359100 [Lethenteron reissneri]|uniref:uncharacterized protein LOC133359100 n=1 Tax=Lethenteron reissneri TaxID=7753 RepID=UPI002AB647E1|nr:uncharacterized protein LOC133359100 [Lethenteron reissneri]XP_061433469.1 uncharacterized protein LOC133359100 [Lethenteron reissneri]